MNKKRNPLHLSSLIKIGVHTDRGNLREHNEDAYSLPQSESLEAQRGTLLCVADGVGGRPEGAIASQEAVAYAQALYYALLRRPDDLVEHLKRCILEVNALNWFHKESYTGEVRLTTLLMTVICHDEIYIASIGDSRAYLIRQDSSAPELLTNDDDPQTPNGQTEDETYVHDYYLRSGVINEAIGLHQTFIPSIYYAQWKPGDKLVLATDGIRVVRPRLLLQIVKQFSPEEAARQLIKLANQEDGSDNSTVMIAHWQQLPDRPSTKVPHSRQHQINVLSSSYLFLGILLGILLVLAIFKLSLFMSG